MRWRCSTPLSTSLSVTVTPPIFVPGGRNTVALTVHNAGPDTAGTIPGVSPSIFVYQDIFIITTQPPPYEIVSPADGCWIERFVGEPLPDRNIALSFGHYFESIPAGQSRTCTYDIEFYSSTRASFPTGWLVRTPNDDDKNPSNDRLDYTFATAPLAPAAPVPTGSTLTWLVLGLGLLTATTIHKRVAG